MSNRVSKAAAAVVANKYAKAVFGNRVEQSKENLSAFAKELYEKYIPLDFRNALDKYKKYYDGYFRLPFKCGEDGFAIWVEGFYVCPNLKSIEVTKEEYDRLREARDKKNELLRNSLAFERNATVNFCKLKTWGMVKKYFPEVADYIPKEVEVIDTLGIEELKKMAKSIKGRRQNMIEKPDYYQADHCPLQKCIFSTLTCNQCCMSGEIVDYRRFCLTTKINSAISSKYRR